MTFLKENYNISPTIEPNKLEEYLI